MTGSTRAEWLCSVLAERIVSGELAPGSALDETQLAAAFGVSRTPVREALRQLAATGLVDARPHRGAVVARPAAARLREMFFVMSELEAMCVALCARTMMRRERDELQAFHRHMGGLVHLGDSHAYRAANVDFHRRLYAGAHNDYLAELAAATRTRLAPFRGAQLEAVDRLPRSHAEHGAIVTAILRGDADSAAAHVREHLQVTEQTWLALNQVTGAGEVTGQAPRRKRAPAPPTAAYG